MFFKNTAMDYVAFKYAGVMAIQINEAMPGNGLGHRNLNNSIALQCWNSSWHDFSLY